jgi:hypothetical protein
LYSPQLVNLMLSSLKSICALILGLTRLSGEWTGLMNETMQIE